jgi:hypothetical protein
MVPNNYGDILMRNVLGGWQFGGVWIIQTGLPFWVVQNLAFSPTCAGNAATMVNGVS